MRNKKAAWYEWLSPAKWGEALGGSIYDNVLAESDGLPLLLDNAPVKAIQKLIEAIDADTSLSPLQRQLKKDKLWDSFIEKSHRLWLERNDRIRARNRGLAYTQLFVDGFNPVGSFIDYGLTPEQKAKRYAYYGVDPTWATTANVFGSIAQMAFTGGIGRGLQAAKVLKPAAWAANKGMALVSRIPSVKKITNLSNAASKLVSNKYGKGVNWLLSKTKPDGKVNKFIRGASSFVGGSAAKASTAFAPLMGAYVADKALTGLAQNFDANSWQHKWLAGSADVLNKAVGFRPMVRASGASQFNLMNMMASPALQRAMQNDLTRNSAKQQLVMAHRGKYDIAHSMNATVDTVRKLESGEIKAELLQNTLDPIVSLYIKAYATLAKMTLEELRNKLADTSYALEFRALMLPALKQASSSEARLFAIQQNIQNMQPHIDRYLFMLQHGRQDPSLSATLAGIATIGATNNLYSKGMRSAQRLAVIKRKQKLGQDVAELYRKYKSAARIPRYFYRTNKAIDTINFGSMFAGAGIHKLPKLVYGKLYLKLTPLQQKFMDKVMTIPNITQSLDLSDNIQDFLTFGPSRSLAAADRHAALRPYYSDRLDDYMPPSAKWDAILRGKLRLALLKLELPRIMDPEAKKKAMRLYKMLQAGIYATGKLLLIIDKADPTNWSKPYTYTPLRKSGLTAGILNELVSIGDSPQNTPMHTDNFYRYSNKLMDLLYTTAKSPADAVLLLLNAPDIFGLSETRSLLGDLIPVFKAYADGLMLRLAQDSSMTTNLKLKQLNRIRQHIISASESASPIMQAKLSVMTLSLRDIAYSIKNGEY